MITTENGAKFRYRRPAQDPVTDDDSEDSGSSSEEDSSDSSDDDDEEEKKKKMLRRRQKKKKAALDANSELIHLPPIEDLTISVPSEQVVQMGTVSTIVDQLVVVKAILNFPAIDLDSVLFLENGLRTLGKVFDVFGPVSEPYYSVR